jgi:hypothetical protein
MKCWIEFCLVETSVLLALCFIHTKWYDILYFLILYTNRTKFLISSNFEYHDGIKNWLMVWCYIGINRILINISLAFTNALCIGIICKIVLKWLNDNVGLCVRTITTLPKIIFHFLNWNYNICILSCVLKEFHTKERRTHSNLACRSFLTK